MSYTLRGRIDSRLLAALGPPLAAACVLALALHRWWPVELAALMVGVGVALDLLVYDRAASPTSRAGSRCRSARVELGVVMALACRAGHSRRRSRPALAFFAAAWLLAQVLGHARLPVAAALVRGGRRRARTAAGALGGAAVAALLARRGRASGSRTRPPIGDARGGRPPGAARDHAARRCSSASRARSSAAGSSCAPTASRSRT